MGFSAYKVTYQDILDAAPSVKLFSLGDLHVKKYFEVNGRVIGYPGSTDMCSITESGEKYVVVTRLDNGVCSVDRELVIESTPVFRVSVTSGEEVGLLPDLRRQIVAAGFSLVHLVYTQEFVEDVRAFAASLDEQNTIIRRKRLSTAFGFATNKPESDTVSVLKHPPDLLGKFEAGQGQYKEYLRLLSDKHHDPRVIVEQLIQAHAPKGLRTI